MWYEPAYDMISEWVMPETGEAFAAPRAVRCGKWVARGPLDPGFLEAEVRKHRATAFTFLQSKVGPRPLAVLALRSLWLC